MKHSSNPKNQLHGNMSSFLFAYGFLKTRFHGSPKTETPDINGELVAEGHYPGRIYRVNVFPGVIFDPDSGATVKGEVFKLHTPEETLHLLDKYENAKPLVELDPDYERRLRPVTTSQGVFECWVYEYIRPVSPATEITTGEF